MINLNNLIPRRLNEETPLQDIPNYMQSEISDADDYPHYRITFLSFRSLTPYRQNVLCNLTLYYNSIKIR